MNRNRAFGRRVKQAREDLCIKRRDLARLSGISRQRIVMIEAGSIDDTDLGAEDLRQLAEALGLPLKTLIEGEAAHPSNLPAGIIGQRVSGPVAQLPFDFGSVLCPRCFSGVVGGRCGRCGSSIE